MQLKRTTAAIAGISCLALALAGCGSSTTGPAPGTPESRFEQFCNENPGACG